MNVSSIAVIGAGTIGRGVAQTAAQHGYSVTLLDVAEPQLDSAREEIRRNLRLQSLFVGGSAAVDQEDVLTRIAFTTDEDAIARSDYVVENIPESWEAKRRLYLKLNSTVSPQTILAANTSAIPITRVASVVDFPDRVVGVHFMNPVHLMPLVELVRGYHTSSETLAVTSELLASLGKEAVLVEDMPGFVTNRVLMLTINEAIYCVQDGVASAADVDRIFKGCFGHKMGPLETADLIGLDTILNSINVMYEAFADSKYRPAPLLKKMVDAEQLGRKSRQGFYRYGISGRDFEGEA